MEYSGYLPWPSPDEMTAEQREFHTTITGSSRAKSRPTPLTDDIGRLHGPFNAMLTHPQLGTTVQQIGTSLRFHGVLPGPLFEAVVLMVAVERNASYEWYAHAPIALEKGMTEAQLEALHEGRWDETDGLLSRQIVQLVRDTLAHRPPTEATIREAEVELGTDGVTEIVVAIGFYELIATLMRTWDQGLPAGEPDPLS